MSIFSKKSLGIDIGSSSIKIVEISSFRRKKKLENYIEFNIPPAENSINIFHGENLLLSSNEVAEVLQALLEKAKIKNKKASFSIPDFSTFFTTFTLPSMTNEEIPQAVEFKARHYIPFPLSEVTFDWQIIDREETNSGAKLNVLLVAVPNTVLKSYQRVADLSQLNLIGMEAEIFGLIRSSIPEGKYQYLPVCLIDIGWNTTTVSIVENKRLRMSFSFDIAGLTLTKDLSSALQVSLEEAEELKQRYGLDQEKKEISAVLLQRIQGLSLEIEKVCQNFYQMEGKRVEDVILAGGTASLFGLKEYLATRIKKNVRIANPFVNIITPPVLQKRLKDLGPSFAIIVGTAMMRED